MNVAFYVSGRAGRLNKLLDHGSDQLVEATRLIFSDDRQNAFLRARVAHLDIDYRCLDFESIERTAERSKNEILSDELLAALKSHGVDYCFSFGDHLLKGEILDAYSYRLINFHPSILPMFPGRLAIDQAATSGSNLLGNTAHFIGAGIDDGPIIMQHVVSARLFDGDYDAILDHQLVMLEQIFRWLRSERVVVTDGKVEVADADYQRSAFFPALDSSDAVS